jgi:hypothetical protein
MAASEYEVGKHVQLVLKSKAKVQGIVFAVDVEGNRIFLEESNSANSSLRDVRVVNLASIESKVIEAAALPVEPLFPLTKEHALKREKAAFIAHEGALLRSGEIHDSLARILFENFSKTYECKWNEREKKIEVVDLGVTIKHPYRSGDVSGRDMRAVQWVREVIAKMQLPK